MEQFPQPTFKILYDRVNLENKPLAYVLLQLKSYCALETKLYSQFKYSIWFSRLQLCYRPESDDLKAEAIMSTGAGLTFVRSDIFRRDM